MLPQSAKSYSVTRNKNRWSRKFKEFVTFSVFAFSVSSKNLLFTKGFFSVLIFFCFPIEFCWYCWGSKNWFFFYLKCLPHFKTILCIRPFTPLGFFTRLYSTKSCMLFSISLMKMWGLRFNVKWTTISIIHQGEPKVSLWPNWLQMKSFKCLPTLQRVLLR